MVNTFDVISGHTNHTTNSLCHLYDVKIAEQDALCETRAVDTFAQDRVMEEDKLTRLVLTIVGESVKESNHD